MMHFLREGDTLVVSEFPRLARSTGDFLRIVETLNQKGVEVKSLKEQLDTSTPQGKFMLIIFGAVFRRAGGMHYTSIENIHKVIDPLFLDELNSEFNSAKNKKDLLLLRTKFPS